MRLEGCADMHYTDMWLGDGWFRAGGFLFFGWLGIFPQVVVLTSYGAKHRIFPL